jgi:hypothetical protein
MMLKSGIAALIVAVTSMAHAQQAEAPAAKAHEALTFGGDIALWTVALRPDKTMDFETVMHRVREALEKSAKPEHRAQATGWKVMRMEKPLPDGNIAYVHVIDPVVPTADYTVMQILYDAFPEERQALYDLYRGAFAQNLALAVGDVAVTMSKREPAVSAVAAP